MIKILWLLESKINSDFINKISNELELKMQISSSFENGLIYDVIILENLSIISLLSEFQKNSILIYVLDEKNNVLETKMTIQLSLADPSSNQVSVPVL